MSESAKGAAPQCATSAYAELDNKVVSGVPVCDFPAPSGSRWILVGGGAHG